MQVNIVKLSEWRIPRQFIQNWVDDVAKELKKTSKHSIAKKELTVVFVDAVRIKQLNQDFRSKAKVTDILSFSGFEDSELGELVLCGDVVDAQARDHKLACNEELGYLLIHGVLHLLGYEHEKGGKAEREMFELQDKVFDILRKRYF